VCQQAPISDDRINANPIQSGDDMRRDAIPQALFALPTAAFGRLPERPLLAVM
jgi:hypothetical protein